MVWLLSFNFSRPPLCLGSTGFVVMCSWWWLMRLIWILLCRYEKTMEGMDKLDPEKKYI